MRNVLISFAVLFSACSVPTAAAETKPVPALPNVEVVANPEEKLICKRLEVIGSLIQSKRVCSSRRNWERSEQHAKDVLEVFTTPGATGSVN